MAETMERVWVSERESAEFGELVERHAGMAFAIALSILRHRADAEDAVQECFLRVMRKKWRLAFVSDERAWIARIAQRCALDVLKRKGGEEPIGEREFPAADAHMDTELQRDLALLRAAIATLPPELRRVIELQQSGELTSDEIGRVLGLPAATVRSRTLKARQLLRQKLERRRT